MNYEKKKTVNVGNRIYCLENWVSLAVEMTSFKDDDGTTRKENRLNIFLPRTDESKIYSTLTINWEGACENRIWEILGVTKDDLEALFLAAECKDE